MESEINENFELAKLALERNDEAIRFSDTKATILLSLSSIVITILFDKSEFLKLLFLNSSHYPRAIVVISLIFLSCGILTVFGATIYVIFPRMNKSLKPGTLFFSDYAGRSEEESKILIANLTAEESIAQLASEIQITSEIAKQKFIGNRVAIIGEVFVILGLLSIYLAALFS